MNKTELANNLVSAVQSQDFNALYQSIQEGQRIARADYLATPEYQRTSIKNLIDTPIETMGLTALHVAVAMYANKAGDREVLNMMVGLLLDYGANPFVPYGQRYRIIRGHGTEQIVMADPGRTLFMDFKGEQLPITLRNWMAEQKEDEIVHSTRIFPKKEQRLLAA